MNTQISTQQTNIKVIWPILFQPPSPTFHNGNSLHYHSPGPQLWKSKLQSRNCYQTSSLRSSIPFPPLSHSLVRDTSSVVATREHITCSQTGLVRLVPAFTSTTWVHPYRPSLAYWALSEPSEEDTPCLLLKSTHFVIDPAPHISPQTFSPHLWQMERTHHLVHLLACLLHWYSRLYSSKMSSLGLQDTILFWFSSCVACGSVFCIS